MAHRVLDAMNRTSPNQVRLPGAAVRPCQLISTIPAITVTAPTRCALLRRSFRKMAAMIVLKIVTVAGEITPPCASGANR
jgi:hypothetical protein